MPFEILNEAASVVDVDPGPPPFNRYPQAEPDKVDIDILVQGINGEGVISGCLVTERAAGQNTTVDITAGVVRIAGALVAYAGGNVNCGAADLALPRFDLIIVNAAGAASAVAGVAARPTLFPAGAAVPTTSVVIAAVWRAANDNTIANADIVDKRAGVDSGTVTFPFVIDGGGANITPGVKGYVPIDFDCEITAWVLLGDNALNQIQIDVWNDTYALYPPTVADTIAGAEKPILMNAIKNQDLALGTWTTTVTAGDILGINVDSVGGTIPQRVTLGLTLQRT